MLRNPWLWLLTLVGAVVGTRFAPTIGEPAAAGAVGVGIIGLVAGFVAGLLLFGIRRIVRRDTKRDAERKRFVEHIGNKLAQRGCRVSVDPSDRGALVFEYLRPDRLHGSDQAELERQMKEKVAGVIERAMTQTDIARDLQLYGFDKLLIRLGDTMLHRVLITCRVRA